jgi:6-phosphogluconolactonase
LTLKLQLRRFDTLAALSLEAADCLGGYLWTSGPGNAAVMLSGGRTPLAVYEELCRRRIPAGNALTLLFSDERNVPESSPDNNYGNARTLIESLGLPDERVIRVRTELGWRESADRYDHELRRFLAGGGRLRLGLLGMGPEGHTASLFTPADVQAGRGRLAIAVARPRPPDRISVTPDLLRQFERVIVLAAGPEKREIVDRLMSTPETVVAGQALRDLPAAEVWLAD